MIKDNKRKCFTHRKPPQQSTEHCPPHPQNRASLNHIHHPHHHHHHPLHNHHQFYHPHHRLHHHVHLEQRHQQKTHQRQQHMHSYQSQYHQCQKRQLFHFRPPHYLPFHERGSEKNLEFLPQQRHVHQRHHSRLQNNSQYPFHQQEPGIKILERGQVPKRQQKQRQQQDGGSFDKDKEEIKKEEEVSKKQPPSTHTVVKVVRHQKGNKDFISCQYQSETDQQITPGKYQKDIGQREEYLLPHYRNILSNFIRSRSLSPPAGPKAFIFSKGDSHFRGNKLFSSGSLKDFTKCESRHIIGSSSTSTVSISSSIENNTVNNKNQIRNNTDIVLNSNNNNNNINNSSSNNSDKANMHLPLHTSLPDGCEVTVDAATERQISQMYSLIQQAAMVGEGYGVDEYPTESDFRQEIKGGHTFVVTTRNESEALGVAEEEEDDEDVDIEEDGTDDEGGGSGRQDRRRLIAAFSLATSKFYRGSDVKVADPIVIVRREERRKGIGEFLFRHAVQFSRRLGFVGIYTDTFSNNTAMIRIIERSPGFKMVGFLPLGGKTPDGTLEEKRKRKKGKKKKKEEEEKKKQEEEEEEKGEEQEEEEEKEEEEEEEEEKEKEEKERRMWK
ncbi:hypothetical protein PoB_003856400 [Plakobranchus ocellatus]|uniref:N-acetyltransferase domain-containing protein n=1 Tax=Plakobranchus ocellatus TaxID=259542 RepID=A0AAV4B122_9GAST|nr:hypothetical protein PoB_003856400 [Plakobranchus ocellatus]